MKQDLIKTKEKDRFETQYYAACLCEYVPIVSMHSDDPDQGQLISLGLTPILLMPQL